MSKFVVILLFILITIVLGTFIVPFILGLAAFFIKAAITFGLFLAFCFGFFIGTFFPHKKVVE